jgi:hypothetical protein
LFKNYEYFFRAASDGNEESLLNRNEVNVKDKNYFGYTALMIAACYNHEGMVSLFLLEGHILIEQTIMEILLWP